MKPWRRILIIKPSSLGDIVQSLPVLAALRAEHPTATIAWLAEATYADFLRHHPDVDVVFSYRRHVRGWLRRCQEQWQLAKALRRFRPEVVLDLQGLARSAWFALLSGARQRLGMSDARELARLGYTRVAGIPPRVQHAVDRYLRVIRTLLGRSAPLQFPLPRQRGAAFWAEEIIARLGGRPAVVCPGARWPTKRWPAEQYAAALRKLAALGVEPWVIVGSASERELARRLRRQCPRVRVADLCGRTTLLELTELLRRARLFLGNDSGTTHLAAAAGCPTVVLFTCTSPERAAPRGAPVRLVRAQVPCAASYLKHCRHLCCMPTITVEAVTAAVLDLLRAADAPRIPPTASRPA